jgi:hypothetical protein
MPLSEPTRTAIRIYLVRELSRYIRENTQDTNALDTKPFHARLLPPLFQVHLSERSFSTRSGSWFQEIARLVASQYHAQARLGYVVAGNIQPAVTAHINAVLGQMNTRKDKRKPNRRQDINEVLTVQFAGGATDSVTSDLFIETHDGQEMYFEMKTPKPNKDTSMAMKRCILKIAAIRKGNSAEAFAATAYNPYGDGKPYKWNYALQFLEVGQDILIGRAFWQKIGDPTTFDELLAISEEAGQEVLPLLKAE